MRGFRFDWLWAWLVCLPLVALADGPARVAGVVSEDAQQAMDTALNAGWDALRVKFHGRPAPRDMDPAATVAAMQAEVVALQALADKYPQARPAWGLRNDIRELRMQIARTQRIALHQPQAALETLKGQFAVVGPEGRSPWPSVMAAEIYRYDLGDKATAIRHYQEALAAVKSMPAADQERSGVFLSRWFESEISFLRTGKLFSGRITNEDLSITYFMLAAAAMHNDWKLKHLGENPGPSLQEVAVAIDGANQRPPSPEQILAAGMVLGQFPSAASLGDFIQRNDPAGYLSATLLAFYDFACTLPDRRGAEAFVSTEVLQEASRRFRRRTGVRFALEAEADEEHR